MNKEKIKKIAEELSSLLEDENEEATLSFESVEEFQEYVSTQKAEFEKNPTEEHRSYLLELIETLKNYEGSVNDLTIPKFTSPYTRSPSVESEGLPSQPEPETGQSFNGVQETVAPNTGVAEGTANLGDAATSGSDAGMGNFAKSKEEAEAVIKSDDYWPADLNSENVTLADRVKNKPLFGFDRGHALHDLVEAIEKQ